METPSKENPGRRRIRSKIDRKLRYYVDGVQKNTEEKLDAAYGINRFVSVENGGYYTIEGEAVVLSALVNKEPRSALATAAIGKIKDLKNKLQREEMDKIVFCVRMKVLEEIETKTLKIYFMNKQMESEWQKGGHSVSGIFQGTRDDDPFKNPIRKT